MFTTGRLIGAAIAAVGVVAALIVAPMLFENLDSSQVMVVQSPISGDLSVYTEPGMKWQGMGSVTKYPRRNEFKFNIGCEVKGGPPQEIARAGDHTSAGLGIRFYDGGNATLCGSISWMMPLKPDDIISIHKDFRSAEAFEVQAIRRSMESSATFSGPTMSSFESAAGRRNELLQIVNEQTLHGVYKTLSKTVRAKDIAGVEKDMQITEIVKDEKGVPIRAQESYVNKYHVVMLPMTISAFKYEDRVEEQIKQQQSATNAAVVAIANAKKADQDAITAEATGKATATKAEWDERTVQAKAIANAQARVTIADASVKEAEAYKKAQILRGEGDARSKELVMAADGQLDKKLEALIKMNDRYATAIEKAQPGAWSPAVVMGGGAGGNGGSNASNLIDLLSAKAAREVGVDLSVKGAAATKK
jgi:hypothetical protein